MLITAISDTHGYLTFMQPADLAVICGDIFPLDFGPRHIVMANVACCDNSKQPSRLALRFSL